MAGPAQQEGQGAGGRAGQQRKDDHRQRAQTGECEPRERGEGAHVHLCQCHVMQRTSFITVRGGLCTHQSHTFP